MIAVGPTHKEEIKIIFKDQPELIDRATQIYEQEMVSDGSWDIKMAVNAGITPVAVLTGYLTASKAKELGAKTVLAQL